MSFKNSGYTILDNTRSIVVQLDSKLSESWTTSSEGMINKLKTEALQGSLFPTIDKTDNPMRFLGYTTGNLNFISVGLDPFTQGTSLVIQHCILRTMLQKTIGKHLVVWSKL
jgi:hypothetical protein